MAHLAEVDARRLYLGEGCSSLFTYCTQVLHLSEHAAYARIEAARAARRFPGLLDAIASGALHLTAVTLIAPHLTAENVDRVISAATYKTKRDVEELVATLRPQPLVSSSVRKLPQARQRPQPRRHLPRKSRRPSRGARLLTRFASTPTAAFRFHGASAAGAAGGRNTAAAFLPIAAGMTVSRFDKSRDR